jgi:hypothetical protein
LFGYTGPLRSRVVGGDCHHDRQGNGSDGQLLEDIPATEAGRQFQRREGRLKELPAS